MDRRLIFAGAALALGVQYFILEAITAAAWTLVPYSYGVNYISDLGVPECIELERIVCSPAHALMNTAFIGQGLLVIAAVIALAGLIRSNKIQWLVAVIAVIHGIGLIMVGLFPGSFAEQLGGDPQRMLLHSLGALLAIGGGNLLLVAITIAAVVERNILIAAVSGALAIVGVGAIVAFASGNDFGLGLGGIERVAAYPPMIVTILAGLWLLQRRKTSPKN